MHRTTDHKSSVNRIVKSIASPFCGRERGFSSFLFVLALLALGSIIIVPLLNYMITGTKAGSTYERKTTEFYSADAGVEYAIWWLQHGLLDAGGFAEKDLTILPYHDGPLAVNNDLVTVTIENEKDEGRYYRIESTAVDTATSSTTTVVSRVEPSIGLQGEFFGNAVTSAGDITIKPGTDIMGDIECTGLLTIGSSANIYGNVMCGNLNNAGTIHGWAKYHEYMAKGTITDPSGGLIPEPPDVSDVWPSVGQLDAYYGDNLTTLSISVSKNTMTVKSYCDLGPGKTGDFTPGVQPADDTITPVNLTIDTKDSVNAVTLTGTVLVTGNLKVTPGSRLDLNGQTLYVRGNIDKPDGVQPGSIFGGSGVIIALGNILFQPSMVGGGLGSESDILHYNGTTWMRMTNPDASLADLNDISGTASANVYAVGKAGTILKYSGAAWAKQNITTVLPSLANLNGVLALSSDNIFVVGDQGTILHYYDPVGSPVLAWYKDAGIGALLPSPTTNLRGIWSDPSEGIYVVGDQATILHSSDGATWTRVSIGVVTTEDLWDVHGVINGSDLELFVVGTQGTILHYRDSSWTKVPPPTAPTVMDLKGVWGFKDATSGDTTYYVVGKAAGGSSTILRYFDEHSDGSGTWLKMFFSPAIDLNDVWGIQSGGITYVFAVGAEGYVLRRSDTIPWTKIGSGISTRELNGVWGLSPSDVFAVGQPKDDFIFVMSVFGTTTLKPSGKFLGSMAGAGDVELFPGSTLRAPIGTGGLNYPKYRWMRLETYVIK